jgi:dipeptidyl aminopeptidase/acylaminoacyl peptidase
MAKATKRPASKPIDVATLWSLARPAGVSLSPDYTHACVSVTRYNMEDNKGQASLWLLPFNGDTPKALTTCGERDGQCAWSPNGQLVAFVAKRNQAGQTDEDAQLYVIDPSGGEARRVTNLANGVSAIKWFADSRRLAFISWVWPDEKGDKAQAARRKAEKESKVKAWVIEKDQYRHWDHWLADGRVPHLFVVDVQTGHCRDLFAGSQWELWQADPDASHYDIAPDGREIVFECDLAEHKRFDHARALVTLDIKSGKTHVLTAKSTLSHSSPRYSPDGRWIACITQDLLRSPIDQGKLSLIDRSHRGPSHCLSSHWDREVQAPLQWSVTSDSVYFCAEDRGRQHVFRWDVSAHVAGDTTRTDPPTRIVEGGVVQEFTLVGEAMVFIRHAIDTPPRVFGCSALGEDVRPLESFNATQLESVQLGATKEFTIRGANNEDVQMWVVYPPNFNPKKKYPLLHSIHGGPHTSFGDLWHYRWNSQVFAAHGYVVALVNYHGSSSFGQQYMASIDGQWGQREFDDVEAGTDFLLRQGYIDKKRLFASGGSYGGKMVALMNGRTDRYKAYVCHAGCFDWVSMFADDAYFWHPKELGAFYWDDPEKVARQSPLTYVREAKTPTLVIHGELDYRVPVTQGFAYYNTLRAKGVPARLVYFPDENHWILKPQNSRLWYDEFFAWLKRFDKAA